MNSSDQHNISVDTAEMTYINDDDSFIDEEEDYKFLNISDSTVMVDRRNFFFDEDIDDSASWIIDKIFDKSHPIIVDSLMFDVETSGDENLSIEEENCITNLKLSADELKLSARSSFNKTVDLTKEVETQDDFMHLRKRLSQPDETEISKITTEQPSFSSNYNLRSNHSKELLENMRDVSLDCIRDSITDLVFLLYSYVEHTRTHNSSEVILSTHTSLCLASNYLERLEQELRGVKHVNKPCHPETYSVMFDFYLKTTGSSYKFIAKTLNMPSLDSMRIKAR